MTERQASGLSKQIEGERWAAVWHEFLTSSAIFPIFDAIRVISANGLGNYLTELAHYIMFCAAWVQAYVLGAQKARYRATGAAALTQVRWVRWRLVASNLVGPLLYSLFDLPIEGARFFHEPYHAVYWGFALLMGLLQGSGTFGGPRWRAFFNVAQSLLRTALFPVVYYLSEVGVETHGWAWENLRRYWSAPGHLFILAAALFLGLLLGLAEAQGDRYAAFLRQAARRLKLYAEWGLGAELVESSFQDPGVLALQRVERTVLFMDIRGFTAWSETRDPAVVVEMLNRFYHVAERVVEAHGGHKPLFTADEVMTRFHEPLSAARTALALQRELAPLLAREGLAVGVGLHRGQVIEGLMGAASTKTFNIIGDTANTAKRLESAAGRGEVLISISVYAVLGDRAVIGPAREITVKGKERPLTIYPLQKLADAEAHQSADER